MHEMYVYMLLYTIDINIQSFFTFNVTFFHLQNLQKVNYVLYIGHNVYRKLYVKLYFVISS